MQLQFVRVGKIFFDEKKTIYKVTDENWKALIL